MKNKIQKIISIMMVFALVTGCFAAMPLANAAGQTIYLKGTGSSFVADGWTNVFFLDGAENAENPNVWHLVYTGNNFNDIVKMQITFTNGEVFAWTQNMGPSLNAGGNNPGWVIVAPYGWVIDYVNKGNNNESPSFLITTEGGNIQFNISGYTEGTQNIEETATFSFEKKVGGLNIKEWMELDDNVAVESRSSVLAGLLFTLTNVDDETCYYVSWPNADGIVEFPKVKPGTYTLSEQVVGGAKNYFVEMENIPDITIVAGINNFFVLGGTVGGFIEGPNIRASDLFTIVNGYDKWYDSGYENTDKYGWGYGSDGIGYPGLNGGGHIFYIGVINTHTGEEFVSFCANAGSTNFAEGDAQYLVSQSMNEEKWIKAFNYIEWKYGDLNEYRVVAQVVTWALLGAVTVDSAPDGLFENSQLTLTEKEMIRDVMANYETFVGGNVVDVLFMTSIYDDYPNGVYDFSGRQPQIVPVHGKFYVQNELDVPSVGSLSVSVGVEKEHKEVTLQKVYQKTIQPIWQKIVQPIWNMIFTQVWQIKVQDVYAPVYAKDVSSRSGTLVTRLEYSGDDAKAVPVNGGAFGNGMTYVKVDVADASADGGIWYTIADSSPNNGKKTPLEYNKPIDYEYNVRIEDGYLYLSLDDRLISAAVTAKLYSEAPTKHDPSGHTTLTVGKELKVPLPTTAASNKAPTATATKNGDDITITVNGVTKTFVKAFVKNGKDDFWLGANNEYKVTVEFNGNGVKSATTIKWPTTTSNDQPEFIYMFVHFEGISWYTTGKYEFTGKYELVDRVVVSDRMVRVDVDTEDTGDVIDLGERLVRKDVVGEELLRTDVSKETVEDDMSDATFRLVVIDPDGAVIYDGTIANGETLVTDELTGLAPGEYTCILTGAGIGKRIQTVTVIAGDDAEVNFVDIIVKGKTVVNWDDDAYDAPIILDKEYTDEPLSVGRFYRIIFNQVKNYLEPIELPPRCDGEPIYLN